MPKRRLWHLETCAHTWDSRTGSWGNGESLWRFRASLNHALSPSASPLSYAAVLIYIPVICTAGNISPVCYKDLSTAIKPDTLDENFACAERFARWSERQVDEQNPNTREHVSWVKLRGFWGSLVPKHDSFRANSFLVF